MFLNDLYHDESALRDRASMVYVCSVIMTYLYHPEGMDDRMMSVFFKCGMQNSLYINGAIPDEDISQYALDYLTAIHNLDLIYHSPQKKA